MKATSSKGRRPLSRCSAWATAALQPNSEIWRLRTTTLQAQTISLHQGRTLLCACSALRGFPVAAKPLLLLLVEDTPLVAVERLYALDRS